MNRSVSHGLSRALCALAAGSLAGGALAQEWPAAPITVVSPVQAGSAGDTSLRLVMAKLSENLKQPVVVENLPGAAGMIGYDRLARAKPDGYTIGGISDSTLTYVPLVQGRKGFNALDALDPVTLLSTSTWVLVSHPSLPVRTVKELVAFSKANPGRLDYASAGIGGSHHVVMEAFKSASGSNLVHVPYRGAAAALADVEAGHVPVMFSALSIALGRIQAKRLTALAVATPIRTPLLPEVPTLQEAGLPGFTFSTWTGVLVPKGTPSPVVERLNSELARVLKDPAVAGKLAALGAAPQPGTPKALAELIESTTHRMRKVIAEAKIRAE
ncbi:MAG: tripartite tricarboxylate transporter substrate binding protein [Betaproteobacteria bacterium]|nr:tripartite tricarboxylate transporter substrate binding protein [Betaproteobacteria bacterium]